MTAVVLHRDHLREKEAGSGETESIREGKKRFKYFVRSVLPTRPPRAIVYFASGKDITSLF